jgi:hypothetical protein
VKITMPLQEWLGAQRRRAHCPHMHLRGIFGEQIRVVGGWRLECLDCGQYLEGPVSLASEGLDLVNSIDNQVRLSIAEKISDRYDTVKVGHEETPDPYTEGLMDAYDIAEQIARGLL